ncbi:kinase-like domain-containing protein [Pseudoneurospora amorphoporcata]|uniref:Kinase-like domain-containing protein n=1 Tax=Pseudoneurospora amorphoporcata TaxID=241081 RepID=A0AAN6SCR8_9PEZI|nr:kinase-like domain-containing protein [Pseudoneurospora amorphoporcata]
MTESISSGSRTPLNSSHYAGDYPRLSSVRDIQCRRYQHESGEVELWEITHLRNPLPCEVRYREKCLVAPGVARGALRIVRQFKPRSLETLVFAKEQVLALREPQFAYHFVQYLQVSQTDNHQANNGITTLYLVTEDFPLGDLRSFVMANGSIREEEARTIMRQICNGLGLLHMEGLAHGDLQLCHVIIVHLPEQNTVQRHREWRVKIGGYRLHHPTAPIRDGSPEDFINTVAYGDISFLSPEVVWGLMLRKPSTFEGGNGTCIQAFDVWAAGEVAAQMLTGSPTFGLDFQKLFDYQAGTISFPPKKLDQAMVSALGKRFIATLMHPDPLMRPTLPLDPRQDVIAEWIEPANCWQSKELKAVPQATLYHNKILPPMMHYTPDGSKLILIDPHSITIRSSSAGCISSWIYENDRHAAYHASALSTCGKRLAVYDAQSHAIKIFDLSKRRNTGPSISYPVSEALIIQPVSHLLLMQLKQRQTILSFHATGSTLLSASPSTIATLDLSVLPNPADPLPYQPKTDSREEPIVNACYTHDGLAMVVSCRSYTTFTLISDGQVTRRVVHPVPARVVAIAPDGHRLILGSKDGDIWSLSTSSFIDSEKDCWVPVWRGVDRYPVESIDIAPSSTPSTRKGVTSANAVTVAVVSGERLILLSIGDDQNDSSLGWVEFKKRKALMAKIKPRMDRENHLEIALWSGGESRITFLKLDGFYEKGGNNDTETVEEQGKEREYKLTSTGGLLICQGEIEFSSASEGEDDEVEDDEKEDDEEENDGEEQEEIGKEGKASSSGCGSWVLNGYSDSE